MEERRGKASWRRRHLHSVARAEALGLGQVVQGVPGKEATCACAQRPEGHRNTQAKMWVCAAAATV